MKKLRLKKDFFSIFKYTQILLWSFITLVALFFIGVNYGLLGEMPDLEKSKTPQSNYFTVQYIVY